MAQTCPAHCEIGSILVCSLIAPSADIHVEERLGFVIVERFKLDLDDDLSLALHAGQGQVRHMPIVSIVKKAFGYIEALWQRQQIYIHEIEAGRAIVRAARDFDD